MNYEYTTGTYGNIGFLLMVTCMECISVHRCGKDYPKRSLINSSLCREGKRSVTENGWGTLGPAQTSFGDPEPIRMQHSTRTKSSCP